jgi:hypothetical protein
MSMPRTTISLPEPLHNFALKESKKLMKREKGVERENMSALCAELIRLRKEQVEADQSKKAA